MRCVAQERQFRYPADSDKPYIRKWLKPGSGEMYYIRTDRGRHRVSLMALVSQRSRLSTSTVTDLSLSLSLSLSLFSLSPRAARAHASLPLFLRLSQHRC